MSALAPFRSSLRTLFATSALVASGSLSLGGCGSSVESAGSGGGGASGSGGSGTGASSSGGEGTAGAGTGGAGDTSCDAPDRSCPELIPYPGGPCEGDLSCDYFDGALEWAFECEGGAWAGGANCDQLGGGCPVAPPTEACDGPFQGELEGALVFVGPPGEGEFRPFEDGESVPIEVGGQGLAMIFFRMQMVGEDLPACAIVTTTIAAEPVPTESFKRVTRFRCGESLSSYVIIPFGDCTPTEPVDTTLTIDIEGVGATEVVLSVPPEGFCGGFG